MKRIIGLMSGTSCDGLDIASCRFEGNAESTQLFLEHVESIDYRPEQREWIRGLTSGKITVSDVAQAHFRLGALFGEWVSGYMRRRQLEGKVDLIVSHGQTVFHQPFAGRSENEPPCTLQIGDGDLIASIAGTKVLSDVRVKDMAFGGQGAPIVVWADYVLFRSPEKNVAMQNIGGIGNVTFLPKNGGLKEVKAFDTGPGNVLIDEACRVLFDEKFDENGEVSSEGVVNLPLLARLREIEESYMAVPPPKSTGKEIRYHQRYWDRLWKLKEEYSCLPHDFVRTLVALTAWSIGESYRRYLGEVERMIVTGGGAFNPTLVRALEETLPGTEIRTLDSDWTKYKEAIAFAVIGNEYLNGHPANVPSATGARKAVTLGKLSLPD